MTISNVPWRIPVQKAYFESRVALKIKHSYQEQAWAYRKSCEIKTGGRSWYVATQEWKICDMEIEIVTFCNKWNMDLTVPSDRQKLIQVRSRSVALCRVFDLTFDGIHLLGNSQTLGCLWTKHLRCIDM